MSKKMEARKLKGFQDFTPELMKIKSDILDKIKEVARLGAFQPMSTPALEYAEVLLGEGGETDKEVFKFVDNGGREVAMRYDLTVPFARFVAERPELTLPYKRFQWGDVWRAEKPQKGRYREFTQCDFDIVGVESLAADTEIILTVLSCFKKIPGIDVIISLGHRKVLNGLISLLFNGQLPESGTIEKVLIAVDKLEKIGKNAVATMLIDLGAAQEKALDWLNGIVESHHPAGMESLKNQLSLFPDSLQAIQDLESIRELAGALGLGSVKIDLSIARGLAYYTGIVYETRIVNLPHFGSVSSGGRYDQLTKRFTDRPLQGVGGSIGLDRLVAALQELALSNPSSTNDSREGIYVAWTQPNYFNRAVEITHQLRLLGLNAQYSLSSGKLAKQFNAANKLNSRFVIVIGDAEFNSNRWTLKDLASGEQWDSLGIDELMGKVGA
jgi:histidyl-tRNA synthetase